jgi:hypothetical protein
MNFLWMDTKLSELGMAYVKKCDSTGAHQIAGSLA